MRRAPLLLLGSASILGALGIAVPACWPAAILGLALFFHLLWVHARSWKEAAWHGLAFGTATGAAGVLWLLDGYPIGWLGVPSPLAQGALVGGTWLATSLVLGAGVALLSPFLYWAGRMPGAPLLAALLWMAAEGARMWAYALFTWAPQSYFGPHFSAAAIGYSLAANHYLLQLAHPWGLAALDFVAAFAAATLALLFPAHGAYRRTRYASAIALAIILALPFLFPYRPAEAARTLHVALLTTDFPLQLPQPEAGDRVRPLLADAARQQADIVAVPEGYIADALPAAERDSLLSQAFAAKDTLVLSSAIAYHASTSAPGPTYGVLTYLSSKAGALATYRKIFLMPVGEYEPAAYAFLYKLLYQPQFGRYLSYIDNFLGRGNDVVSVPFDGTRVGALLCSDLVAPSLYEELAAQHARVLVNLSNQDWFHHSHVLYAKTKEMAAVAAVQARAPFLLANNGAPSFALDATGAVVSETPWHAETVLYVDVPARP